MMSILENHRVIIFEINFSYLYTYRDINKMIYRGDLFSWSCLFSTNIR